MPVSRRTGWVKKRRKVPDVFWHELRNLLLSVKCWRWIDVHHAKVSMTRLRRRRIHRAEDSDDREIMALARGHRLTAYDARFLAFAIREGCASASLDLRLNEAAAAERAAPFV